MSFRTTSELFFVGACELIRIGLRKFSAGPCQDCSSETTACQSSPKYLVAPDKGLDKGVKFRATVLEKLGGTIVRISEQTTQFPKASFFSQSLLEREYPFLLTNNMQGSFSYPGRQVCFFDQLFVGFRQAG